ncbi:unnamed protein product [Cuscuta epithymum]|uniref:Integrator complex subunit 7 n=1 Tax=Cuscuta epithymum TaxID=186058 RepID=A0AAV0GLP2_9ASTE|nr:unnamed protein product [Cuscuta epithymum]
MGLPWHHIQGQVGQPCIAKDNADLRCIVLSSLVSKNIQEVKASLFAAGCFCELANHDFAAVHLEMLVNLMSHETPTAIRLAAGRAFAQLWFSILLADRAYKRGVKLMLDYLPEEEFSKLMLISLSKIASKWTSLIPVQVELLISLISQEMRASCLQATAIKCLDFILCHVVIFPESTTHSVLKFFGVLNESKLSPDLQCVALNIFYKVFLYNLHRIPHVEAMTIFSRFLVCVQLILESSVIMISERLLAIHILGDVSVKLLERMEGEASSDQISSTVASKIISFSMDRLSLMVKTNEYILLQPNDVVDQEIKCLFSLLLDLFEKKQELGVLLLDKMCLFISGLVNAWNEVTKKLNIDDNSIDPPRPEENSNSAALERIMICASKVIRNCFFQNQENWSSTSEVIGTIKILVKHVCGCRSLHIHIHVIYDLLLHSCLKYSLLCRIMNSTENICPSPHEYEHSTPEYVRVILGRRKEHWLCYKLGKYAVCQGAWITATLIFEQLSTTVQSKACHSWLESLTCLSRTEREFQSLVNFDLTQITTCGKSSYIEAILGACNDLRSSVCRLGGGDSSTSGPAFCFQRWFLTLRVKVVEAVLDSIKLLISTYSSSGTSYSLQNPFVQVSVRMKSLSQEFDLFATSFIGIDRESRTVVSSLSQSCSLLAFTTAFLNCLMANFSEGIISDQVVDEQIFAMLSHDLFGRLLLHMDNETRKILLSKLTPNTVFLPQLRNPSSNYSGGCEVAKLCRYAVRVILELQNELLTDGKSPDGDDLKEINKSRFLSEASKRLFNVLSLWIRITCWTPKHFFQLRPCVGSELFLIGEDGEKSDGLSVSSGIVLHLNLCLQLSNWPCKMSNLYCVLHCGPASFQKSSHGRNNKEHKKYLGSQNEIDNMVYLNRKLMRYTRGSIDDDDTRGGSFSFVCFEVNKKKWQGFSTCLLDTSAFPVGSYEIRWHSCCIDKEGSYWSFIPVHGTSFALTIK